MRRRAAAVLAAATALAVVTGCVADPPPPTVVGEDGGDGTTVTLDASGVLLTLDRVDPGFNPHLLADQGVDTDLIASLLLPSAFVPGPGGEPVLNTSLLVAAGPLPGAPETIRYTIHPQAQWSDGVPVAAEDFEYLWRQMTTQPGVVDPAGYERIRAVRAGAGGKVVDVVFDRPPEHWRSLFDHLLPGHILKDAPDGFQGAMSTLPVMSAGPFMIRAADIGRGEIEFVRNDRYWEQPPVPDQIVVRRAIGPGQLGASLRGGPGALALVAATPVSAAVAATVPGARSVQTRAEVQLELGLNTVSENMDEVSVRRAVAAAVSPEVVGRIVTGQASPTVTRYPFPAGSPATPTGLPEVVVEELSAAGYTSTGTRWVRDGEPLVVTLGVEAADERAVTAANTVADQLRGAGIGAQVWELDPVELYADALPHGLVDGVVGWQRADGHAEIAATSRFACVDPDRGAGPDDRGVSGERDTREGDHNDDDNTSSDVPTRPRTTVPSLVPPEPESGQTSPTATAGSTTTVTTVPRTIGVDAPARAADVAGVCDPVLDRALGVNGGPVDLVAASERVAELALRIPLVRPSLLLSSNGVDMTGIDPEPNGSDEFVPGDVSDVFDTAPTWRRIG